MKCGEGVPAGTLLSQVLSQAGKLPHCTEQGAEPWLGLACVCALHKF